MGDVIEFKSRKARQDQNLRAHGIEHPAAFRGDGETDEIDALIDEVLARQARAIHLTDIDGDAVRRAVELAGGSFVTRDVSESAIMREAHGSLAEAPAYHQVIGRWLSLNRDPLGLRIATYRTPRGARWAKTADGDN